MIWLTWRQHRSILAAMSAVVLALMIWMLIVEHNYVTTLHAISQSCSPSQFHTSTSTCSELYSRQSSALDQAGVIRLLILAVPILFGALLGAPLFAGELERKTILLALTQGISRTRWAVIRWAVVVIAVLALSLTFALFAQWWFGQVTVKGTPSSLRIVPGHFDITGIVPVAYALFAFALGATLGMVLRRTTRAIFGTIVIFIVIRTLFEQHLRPYLATRSFLPFLPHVYGSTPTATFGQFNKIWDLGPGYRVSPGSGHPTSQAYINHVLNACTNPGVLNFNRCVANHGVQFGIFFQPASHYWALQWGESAAFVLAAGVLFALALWSLRRWRA